jgi:hypothetical protein
MLTVTHTLSNEEPHAYATPNGPIPRSGFALWFYAHDRDQRPWRLSVLISHPLGFGGIRIERTDTPEYRESDLEEDVEDEYPPFVQVDTSAALCRVDAEFKRAGAAEWTRIYTDVWAQRCDEYERFRATVAGEREIESYAGWTRAQTVHDDVDEPAT